jgi:hypothetical protein
MNATIFELGEILSPFVCSAHQVYNHRWPAVAMTDRVSGRPKRSNARSASRAGPERNGRPAQMRRSIIIFLSSAIALAGLSPLGQALAQLRIV